MIYTIITQLFVQSFYKIKEHGTTRSSPRVLTTGHRAAQIDGGWSDLASATQRRASLLQREVDGCGVDDVADGAAAARGRRSEVEVEQDAGACLLPCHAEEMKRGKTNVGLGEEIPLRKEQRGGGWR
jgi:hypothetical protein